MRRSTIRIPAPGPGKFEGFYTYALRCRSRYVVLKRYHIYKLELRLRGRSFFVPSLCRTATPLHRGSRYILIPPPLFHAVTASARVQSYHSNDYLLWSLFGMRSFILSFLCTILLFTPHSAFVSANTQSPTCASLFYQFLVRSQLA